MLLLHIYIDLFFNLILHLLFAKLEDSFQLKFLFFVNILILFC